MKLPDFITIGSDGDSETATVSLVRGIKIDGETRKTLTMREPSVGDMIAARRAANDDTAMTEVILIANLAGVTPENIQSAKMRDYSRLQEALGFMSG